MLNLNNITLSCIDTKNITESLLSLNYSCKYINFNKIIFFTDNANINISKFKHLYNKLEIIQIPKILNKIDYSKFCLIKLPYYINTDYCLTVQHDGFVSCPDMWTDEFLKYDYIGAPWPESWGYINRVGNGGFNLKSKKFLNCCKILFSDYNFIINSSPKDISQNEDLLTSIVYYKEMLDMGIKFAPVEIASLFSIEHITKEIKERAFGFHDKFTNFSINSHLKKYDLEY